MRRLTCPYLPHEYQIHHPSSMLVVGSTGVGKVILTVSYYCLPNL